MVRRTCCSAKNCKHYVNLFFQDINIYKTSLPALPETGLLVNPTNVTHQSRSALSIAIESALRDLNG